MNFKNFHLQPTFAVSIVAQSSQPKSASQPEQNIGYFAGIFVTFTIIGFMLGCVLRYRSFKKQRHQRSIEIIRTIESLDNIQALRTEIDQEMTTERKQHIETLEEIWKKSS